MLNLTLNLTLTLVLTLTQTLTLDFTSALDPRLDKFSKSNPVRRTFAKMRPTTSGVKLHTQLSCGLAVV